MSGASFDPSSFMTPLNGNRLQYSCLENPMDGGAWWATVHGVAKGRTRLSDFTMTTMLYLSLYPSCLKQSLVYSRC